MPTTEILLRDDGSLVERTVTERPLAAGPDVLDALTESVTRALRRVAVLPEWGAVNASAGLDDTLWTVRLTQLPLHTHYRLVADVLVPSFTEATDLDLPLVWRPPPDMRLAFVLATEPAGDRVIVHDNHLFACDAEKRGFRLPLPNLFDDCRICTGEFPREHPSGLAAVQACLEQFRKSRWNADLMQSVEQAQQCFRFQPTDDAFLPLPVAAEDWTTLCQKVSTDILERVIL